MEEVNTPKRRTRTVTSEVTTETPKVVVTEVSSSSSSVDEPQLSAQTLAEIEAGRETLKAHARSQQD